MAATVGTSMATLGRRCFTIKSSKNMITYKPTLKSISLLPQISTESFTSISPLNSNHSTSIISAVVSTLISSDSAFGAEVTADTGEGDKRVLAILLPIIPAVAWVLYNILGPALNQINRMRSGK